MSSNLPNVESGAPKSMRVLACVLCQQRKVKCDRKFPCVNCIRGGAQCVPAALVRRPRKRRFPERELLDRLHRYEDLLREHSVSFEPLHKDNAGDLNAILRAETADESDDEESKAKGSDWSSPSTTNKPERAPEAKEFWHTVRQVFQDYDYASDTSFEKGRDPGTVNAWDKAFKGANDHFLLGSRKIPVDLSILHPEPAQIFRLWQIYLDNVDPLLKVTHNPSLQGRIAEASSNITNISTVLEALMFGIYCISIQSLNFDDCQAMFGSSKEDLLSRYEFAAQQALSNCNFLQSSDRSCLTAFYLYLVSVGRRTHPRAISSMLAVAIRTAQRMGLDSEVACAKLPPFEAEMSRRLWWSLMLFDSRMSELAGHKSSMLSPAWDCSMPLNVNDSDLRPEMKVPPTVQGKTTEALFTVIRSEMGDFIRKTKFHLEFTSPALKPIIDKSIKKSLPDGDALAAFEKTIESKYIKFCNPENPLHFMTTWTTRTHLAKCRLLEHHSTYSDSSVNQAESHYDTAMSYALRMLECDTKVLSSPLTKSYTWFLDFHFPFIAYMHIVQDLQRRPLSKQASRAWETMSDNYEARFLGPALGESSHFILFAKTVLQGWDSYEAKFKQSGKPLTQPQIVSHIKLRLGNGAQDASNVDAELSFVNAGMSLSGFLMPMATGLDGSIMPSDMNGQTDYIGANSILHPGMLGQVPLNSEIRQPNWASMGWELDER